MRKKISIILYILLFVHLMGFGQNEAKGYNIAVEVSGLADTSLILAHRYGSQFFSDDTVQLNHNGKGSFTGEYQLPFGMYQLVFPDKTFLDFFIDSDQHFKLTTKIPDFISHNHAQGHAQNEIFFNWHRASTKYRNTPNLQTVWDTTLVSLKGSLAGKFLSGIKPFDVPASLKNDKNFSSNQLAQYTYYKEHFFDHVDFSDPGLLRTPLIYNKLNQFFSKVVPPQPDSISWYCDWVLTQASENKEVFRFTLQHLLNTFAEPKIMGTDAVYVHLAQQYYLNGQADWIDDGNLQIIEGRVAELIDLLIGKPAPKLEGLETPEGEAIDPLESSSRFTVLYFWEPDCGHCKTSTPQLFQDYEAIKNLGAEVYAINTRSDVTKWTAFIAEHELTWINLHCPTQIRDLLENYKAWSTPLSFILDSEKRIVAKDLSVGQVKEYLRFLNK